MGINIILNRQLYHFSDPDSLVEILDQYADDCMEVQEPNGILTDDEWDNR